MSWEVTLMSTWTAAGGVPVASLGHALPGSSRRRELGARGTATLVLDAMFAWALTTPRAILRVDRRHSGGYFEVRVAKRSRATRGVDGTRFSVIGQPRVYDLGDSDLVREVLGGRTITRFNENLTPREYFERFWFVNQVADGLQGIVLGTVESDEKIPLAWDRWTRGQLTDAVQQAAVLELQWRVLTDGTEALDLLRAVGEQAPVVPLRYGDLLLEHQIEEDYAGLYTIARAAGEQPTAESERATIGENLWRVASRVDLGAGSIQLELRAINSDASPIVESGQYAAHPESGLPARYLQAVNGTPALPILSSDVDTSTVVVSGAAPATGDFVSIVADASGTPLEVLELPSAVAAYGAVVGDVQITGARGERQYARNGGHEDGLARWSAVNAGVAAEYARDEFGTTLSGLSDGSRSAGTSTATPLALKGLPPGEKVRQGDAIRIGGATCVVQSDAIPDNTGALSLSVSPGLPGAYADGTVFTLERREVRALQTHDSALNPLCEYMLLDDVDTLNLGRFGLSGLSVTGGGYTFPLSTFQWEHNGKIYGNWRRAGRVAMTMPLDAATGVPTTTWATKDDDLYTVQPLSFVFVTGSRIRKPTESQWTAEGYAQAKMTFSAGDIALLSVGTMVRWKARSGTPGHRVYPADDARGDYASPLAGAFTWWCAVVTAITGTEATLTAHQPFGTESVMLGIPEYATPGDAGSGLAAIYASDVSIAANTATSWVHTKESRPLTLNGSHSLGATTVAFKPIAIVATKNYASGDTFAFTRVERWRIKTTAATETRITDGLGAFLRYEITFTLDTGLSTIGSIEGGYPITGGFYQADPVIAQTLTIVSATSTTIVVHSPFDTPDFFAEEQDLYVTRSFTDTFTVSSVASAWSAAGTCTLNVTPTVPAGRNYGAGWRNITISAPSGAPTSSDLVVLATALVAGATQIQLAGSDTANVGTTAPNTSGSYAVYRVTANTGSRLPIQGNTLYAAATATVAGDGTASVTVTAANANAIANNEVATITRPALIPSNVPTTGSAMRLFSAVGGSGVPLTTSAGHAHELAYVRVPAGSTRTLTVRALFTLSEGDWFAGQGPVVAIVDAIGTILGYASLDSEGLAVEVAPGIVELTAQATVGASGFYGIRVFGGTTDYSRWCVHVRSMLYLGEAPDAPYSNESFASALMLSVLRRLVQESEPRITDQLSAVEVTAAHAQAMGLAPALRPTFTEGGLVHLEDWGREVRVTAITETPTAEVASIEVGQLARDAWRLLGETALKSGNRRIR